MKKESQALQLLIGCFSIIGVIFTILGFIVAVLMIFHQQPIYVFLESILPTPTAAPGVVPRATPATAPPTTTQALATLTPIAQQNPPPGEIVPAGQPIAKGDIFVYMEDYVNVMGDLFTFSFHIENQSDRQIIVRYKPSDIHVTDDLGTKYRHVLGDEGKIVSQFSIDPGERGSIKTYRNYLNVDVHVAGFQGPISPDAKYLIVTIDKLVGMENLMWRYDLP